MIAIFLKYTLFSYYGDIYNYNDDHEQIYTFWLMYKIFVLLINPRYIPEQNQRNN